MFHLNSTFSISEKSYVNAVVSMKNYSTELINNLIDKKIIITGCNGYIGNELTKQLELNNIDYIGIDKTPNKKSNILIGRC